MRRSTGRRVALSSATVGTPDAPGARIMPTAAYGISATRRWPMVPSDGIHRRIDTGKGGNRVPNMPYPRPTARTLIRRSVRTPAGLRPQLRPSRQRPDPSRPTWSSTQDAVCAGKMPTRWPDELHPPDTVRVLRSKGPNAGDVETVNFWKYVGRVMRAEYSTGADKPPLWMHVGAMTVKQYGVVEGHALGWRPCVVQHDDPVTGRRRPRPSASTSRTPPPIRSTSRINRTDDPRFTTRATSRRRQSAGDGADVAHDDAQVAADREQDPPVPVRLSLGQEAAVWRRRDRASRSISKSLRDCGAKNVTLEETMREYFEPNMLVVDTRDRDIAERQPWWAICPSCRRVVGIRPGPSYPGKVERLRFRPERHLQHCLQLDRGLLSRQCRSAPDKHLGRRQEHARRHGRGHQRHRLRGQGNGQRLFEHAHPDPLRWWCR